MTLLVHLGVLVVEQDEEAREGRRAGRGGGRGGGGDALHCAAAELQAPSGHGAQQEVLCLQVLHPLELTVPELDQGAGGEVGEQPGKWFREGRWRGGGGGGLKDRFTLCLERGELVL